MYNANFSVLLFTDRHSKEGLELKVNNFKFVRWNRRYSTEFLILILEKNFPSLVFKLQLGLKEERDIGTSEILYKLLGL